MYVGQTVNFHKLVVVGGCAGSGSLSLCRGRLIAFRWYLSVSIPYLLRRSKFIPVTKSSYMFASTNLRYHPFDSIDSSYSHWETFLLSHCDCFFLTRLFDTSLLSVYDNVLSSRFGGCNLGFRRHVWIFFFRFQSSLQSFLFLLLSS